MAARELASSVAKDVLYRSPTAIEKKIFGSLFLLAVITPPVIDKTAVRIIDVVERILLPADNAKPNEPLDPGARNLAQNYESIEHQRRIEHFIGKQSIR